ncbi:putative LRR receptor-like serine/threonine-protein kinase-like [Capsicum annuum]|nr:putative LRR receptor-like serine/threonine-protein kinase-like [Capsicum annuum]
MADPVRDVAFLQDAVNELRNQLCDLQWELGGVRSRMLREIRRLRRALILPIEDWLAGNDDADNNNNNKTRIMEQERNETTWFGGVDGNNPMFNEECVLDQVSVDKLKILAETGKKVRKPKPWKHSEPITRAQLVQMRDEFWDTAPHYGGRKGKFLDNFYEPLHVSGTTGSIELDVYDQIWDALRAAAEADISLAQTIVDSAGIIVQAADLTVCYDERGAKYELPKYVLSEPTNLTGEN